MARFAVTIFLSAFLLFQIQPMIGKYILPWFGGSAGVWTTCMLFFQVLLLLGYAYAHLLSSRVPWKWQGVVHLIALLASVAFLPIGPDADTWKPTSADDPAGRILFMLLVNIGLPYFLLSATGPLLQSWFSGANPGRSPYRLYSLSNIGSLLALASYPLLFERIAGVSTHVIWWTYGFIAFLLACGWCAIRVARSEHALHGGQDDPAVAAVEGQPVPREDSPVTKPRPSIGRIFMWLMLAASASAMLLATTNQLTQEVASVPFLWVIPLILYLLSFIICFDNERWYIRQVYGALLLASVPLAVVMLEVGVSGELWVQIAVYSTVLFACCMTCHGELVKTKPDPSHLTLFYLTVSAGGAIGGAFVALAAPNLFNGYYEYQVALVACAAITFLAWFVQRRELDKEPILLLRYGLALFIGLFVMFTATVAYDEPFSYWPFETVQEGDEAEAFGVVLSDLLATRSFTFEYAEDKTVEIQLLILMMVWVIGVTAAFFADFGLKKGIGKPVVCWVATPLAILILTMALIGQVTDSGDDTILQTRNFYGVMRVEEYDKYVWPEDDVLATMDPNDYYVNDDGDAYVPMGRIRRLIHGRILHGFQFLDEEKQQWHSSYYAEKSGVGLALLRHPKRLAGDGNLNIGLIGLGTGTVSTYAGEGDTLRIYEINPEVEEVAREFFTYLEASPAKPKVVLGDARIQMELEKKRDALNNFDVFIVDAFSSDAIPLHLLTRECIQLYFDHLNSETGNEGLLVIHISNRFVDLNPVVRGLADEFKCQIARFSSSDDDLRGVTGSTWVVLTRNEAFLSDPTVKRQISEYSKGARPPVLWTDDRTSMWELLKF